VLGWRDFELGVSEQRGKLLIGERLNVAVMSR
jgi:hypothetical protein